MTRFKSKLELGKLYKDSRTGIEGLGRPRFGYLYGRRDAGSNPVGAIGPVAQRIERVTPELNNTSTLIHI